MAMKNTGCIDLEIAYKDLSQLISKMKQWKRDTETIFVPMRLDEYIGDAMLIKRDLEAAAKQFKSLVERD